MKKLLLLITIPLLFSCTYKKKEIQYKNKKEIQHKNWLTQYGLSVKIPENWWPIDVPEETWESARSSIRNNTKLSTETRFTKIPEKIFLESKSWMILPSKYEDIPHNPEDILQIQKNEDFFLVTLGAEPYNGGTTTEFLDVIIPEIEKVGSKLNYRIENVNGIERIYVEYIFGNSQIIQIVIQDNVFPRKKDRIIITFAGSIDNNDSKKSDFIEFINSIKTI